MTEGNHKMKVLRPDDPGLTEKRLDTAPPATRTTKRSPRWTNTGVAITYDENMAPLLADVKTIEAALKKTPGLLDASLKSKLMM